jgi:UDP-3-O-[3-hydroxymyristoyl] glucosamine N-acyltransferase
MIIGNQKPMRIIGYVESSMTQEFLQAIGKTHTVDVIHPSKFQIDPDYQYIVSISVDLAERQQIIERIDQHSLDLVTFIHDTSLIGTAPPANIGPGSFIFPFTIIALGSVIGRHCIIGSHNLIGHYSQLGNNCITRPGVTICDKSTVGNHCVFNFKSTVINKATVTDHVEVMALTNIVKDVSHPGKYVGTLARRIKDS